MHGNVERIADYKTSGDWRREIALAERPRRKSYAAMRWVESQANPAATKCQALGRGRARTATERIATTTIGNRRPIKGGQLPSKSCLEGPKCAASTKQLSARLVRILDVVNCTDRCQWIDRARSG